MHETLTVVTEMQCRRKKSKFGDRAFTVLTTAWNP